MAISTVNITNKQNAGEPNTQGAFSIVRTGDLTQPLTVKINTISQFSLLDSASSSYATPGEDYQVLPTTVTFAAGQSSLDLPVIPIDDTIPENTQTIKVSIVADAAYALGTNQTATVLLTDNDLVTTVPAGTLKTAAEAGYTIKKLSSNNITGFHIISGKLVVWQEGAGDANSSLKLFDGTKIITLNTDTSKLYKSYNIANFYFSSARIDNGKVIWGQLVDETSSAGYTTSPNHTFLYDGTTTTDLGTGSNAQIAGDRIVWATDGGINIYRISDKSNTLVPGAKNVTNLAIDSDKSIVWNENTRATSLTGTSDQTLKFYDGTKIVDLVTLPAGKDVYSQPAEIKAVVSGGKVVYVSKGDLYLYNNGQSTKIAENVFNDFGINGDQIFYQTVGVPAYAFGERIYSISSGKTENPIEDVPGSLGSTSLGVSTDGKNVAWVNTALGGVNEVYFDDGTTRIDLDPTSSTLHLESNPKVSGSNVAYNVSDISISATYVASSTHDLYLASKDSLPNIPVNKPPVVANPISAQSIVSGSALKFIFAANTFTDPDSGDVLSYSAKLANGSNLPTWLTFDAVTRTFAGTPAAGDVGNIGIVITATDKAGLTVATNFGLTIAAPPNNAPVVANPISTQSIVSGSALKFIFAANTFTDPDSGDVLSYSAKLANGNNLPTWLTFDAVTRTFAGTPAAGDAGNLSIAVTATDKAGLKVSSNFGLNIAAAVVTPPSSPTTVNFTATDFYVSSLIQSVAIGDFNGDGISDLATANGANNVSVLLGDGKGSFGTPAYFAAGSDVLSVAVGDFNGDGISDFVTSSQYNNNVVVLLGNGKGGFGTPINFTVGTNPNSVTVGDFNGDGISDFVTANYKDNNVSVILGGKGGFGTPTNFAVGTQPGSITVGDFNGDGISDLVTANHYSNNVSILLGNGKGGFSTPTNFAIGTIPVSVKVGDFNGDGISDLVTANQYSNTVSVLLGTGKGSFSTPTNFAVPSFPNFVIVGDLNGDGIADLVTSNAYNVSVLLGNGKGSFGTPTNFTESSPHSIVIGDFNGDGISDLATTNGSSVSVLLNKTFVTSVNNPPVVANPISTQSIVSGSALKFIFAANTFTDPDAGDVLSYSAKLANGNNLPTWLTFDATTRTFAGTPAAGDVGNLSIAVTATDKAGLAVATNFGLTIAAPTNNAPVVANPISSQSIVAGNAVKFVLAANTFTDPDSGDVLTYSAKLANGNNLPTWLTFDAVTRTFAGTPAAGDAGNLSIAVTATDKAGLKVASNFGLNITTAAIVLPSSPTTVNFGSATDFAVGSGPLSVTVGDFNGDGIADLATANYGNGNVSVLLGTGKGSFAAATNFGTGSAPAWVTVGDFNGDGLSDIVAANYGDSTVSILLGNGKGSFTTNSFATGHSPSSVAVGDFNGDGISDLATANGDTQGNNSVSILLGNGKGSFSTPTDFAVGANPKSIKVGDFNGDGISDLVTANFKDNNVSVLLGNGKGNFTTPTNFAVGTNPLSVSVGDFNGDGISDLVTANENSKSVSVLLGDGKGSFATATNFAVGNGPYSVTVGDFNGDGISDIVAANYGNNNVSVLIGDGKGSFTSATNFAVGNIPLLVTSGDFNGDGKSDLVTVNYFGNDVSVLLNNTNTATPVNNAPVVANPISTQSIVSGSALKFIFAANTFTDPDSGDILSYSAKLANGNNLPTWLTFDATTRTFAGTPAAGDVGNLSIAVTATDKAGLTVASNFGLNITGVIPPSSGGLIAGLTIANNLFSTDAFLKGFGITAISQKPTTKANEIGFFAVDDLSGKVNGIAFGSVGYAKAVLDAAKPIFSTLGGNFFSSVKQEFAIDPNKIYEFFEIQDGSIVDLQQQIASGKTPTNIRYSLPDSSGNSPFKLTSNSKNDGYQISVNTDELVLNLVNLAGSSVNLPIGTKSQTAPEGRTFDFTDYVSKTLKVDITTTSDAAYNNNIGFYTVEDSIGSIKLANGSTLKPGDANYAIEAIKNALTNSQLQAGKNDSKLDRMITGGKTYAPVMVAQGTLNDFVTNNPNNTGDGSKIHAYFNYLGANPDKLDHFRLVGNNTFGVEDLYGGGDRDFNDLIVNFNVKSVA